MQEFLLRHFMISTHQPILQVRASLCIINAGAPSLRSSCAKPFCNLRKLLHFSLLFSEMTRFDKTIYQGEIYSALAQTMRKDYRRIFIQTSNVKRTAVSIFIASCLHPYIFK